MSRDNKTFNFQKYIGPYILIFTLFFSSGNFAWQITHFQDTKFTFIAVGQGDSCFIKTKDGRNLLVDAGNSSRSDKYKSQCYKYLQKSGIDHIDIAFISHYDADHMNGLFEISKNIKIRVLIIPKYVNEEEKEKLQELHDNAPNMKILFANDGNRILVNQNISLKEFLPDIDENSSSNERNLVLEAKCHEKKLLFTGDLSKNCELKLIGKLSKCDILKVAHHGSRFSTSEEFLQKINPKYAVICVGRNNYGHPSKEVLERLNLHNIQIFRTDQDGTIDFKISNRKNINTNKFIRY